MTGKCRRRRLTGPLKISEKTPFCRISTALGCLPKPMLRNMSRQRTRGSSQPQKATLQRSPSEPSQKQHLLSAQALEPTELSGRTSLNCRRGTKKDRRDAGLKTRRDTALALLEGGVRLAQRRQHGLITA